MADFAILLDDLDVAMRLGIHPHEQVPQRVRLSVRLTVDYPLAPSADAIDEVLDYDTIRDGIRALADGPGFALQETLVEAIAAQCLSDHRVREVRVRSMKLDVYPDARVGCEIVRNRASHAA
ncbi:dihydroneopterin aldolase [Sphingomonas sp. Leaf412]|uniref:dihydroneopterin aldolase n=1 Tax=Sphingomonas sp. Leaf412 TaxID=1736370 RepID=UPI0006F7983A|nr:dihydroneopterin aldolase [Sphingomonas sp. Leaf412]KQT32589.1 dihydroneopterin aldolase [Sphingomonas sp. Leaf412]